MFHAILVFREIEYVFRERKSRNKRRHSFAIIFEFILFDHSLIYCLYMNVIRTFPLVSDTFRFADFYLINEGP
jgi:hypothetical protein